jgi:hypothetical protein
VAEERENSADPAVQVIASVGRIGQYPDADEDHDQQGNDSGHEMTVASAVHYANRGKRTLCGLLLARATLRITRDRELVTCEDCQQAINNWRKKN